MSAEQLVREGDLEGGLQNLQNRIRKDPSSVRDRIFLFQLLVTMGQWPRALTQLNITGEFDAANLAMVQTYREAIRCELLRQQIFAGKRTPLIMGDPEQWQALLLESLRLAAEQKFYEAHKLRDQAFDLAPATPGTINGQRFDWIADADSRLGPVLEVIVNGGYYWVPFHRIKTIQLEAPEDLRDMVWMPAHFVWDNGGEAFGLIPTRYPGSENCEDSAIRLARKTEWQDQGDGVYFGMGQRLLTTPENDFALMDIREIQLDLAD
ncbi:MAG: virulence protein SciE type [Methylomicrobium sp.]|nr:virulence protein SciE type [Methylomicrobium sp.]